MPDHSRETSFLHSMDKCLFVESVSVPWFRWIHRRRKDSGGCYLKTVFLVFPVLQNKKQKDWSHAEKHQTRNTRQIDQVFLVFHARKSIPLKGGLEHWEHQKNIKFRIYRNRPRPSDPDRRAGH